MNLRKIKKSDLYPILDEIQKRIKQKYCIDLIYDTHSDYYGEYKRELLFMVDYSTTEKRRISSELLSEFNRLYCGYAEVILENFPNNYPKEIDEYYGGKMVAFYISTERLNNLPINDDKSVAKFLFKNKQDILKIIGR